MTVTNDVPPAVVVCHLVRDMPIPSVRARIVPCCDCGQRCWLADSSPQNFPTLCFQCVKIVVEKDGEPTAVYATERQLRDRDTKNMMSKAQLLELLDRAIQGLK